VWLDVRADPDQNREKMMRHRHTRYLVCEGGLDQVLGMVDVKDLLAAALAGRPVDDLRNALHKPLFLPESTRAFRLLEEFRESGTHLALAIDEYGGIQGLVTLNDIMEGIVGEVAQAGGVAEPALVQREDGSWLVNGSTPMAELRDVLGVQEWQGAYRTVGGFVITHLGRIPAAGDYFDLSGFRVEVMDMDGSRVDKVLVAPHPGTI
jgi:putative hemolysin